MSFIIQSHNLSLVISISQLYSDVSFIIVANGGNVYLAENDALAAVPWSATKLDTKSWTHLVQKLVSYALILYTLILISHATI